MNGDRVQRFGIIVALLGLTFDQSIAPRYRAVWFSQFGMYLVLIAVVLGAVGLFLD